MRRQPDLRAACAAFLAEMQRLDDWQVKYEAEHGSAFSDERYGPDGDTPAREEPKAERLLQELRMIADDDLHRAARAYLDEYLMVWWGPPHGEERRRTDLPGARDSFVMASRKAIYGE